MNKLILVLLVCLASANALPVESVQAKGIVDLIINTFNLQSGNILKNILNFYNIINK
jgi:hypothetical protein